MKTVHFEAETLRDFLLEKKIATINELKRVLKTNTTMTVLRKLKELSYITSYSHRGKYYTLKNIPNFNDYGLWTFGEAHFSQYNTLLDTIITLIEKSEKGYSAKELSNILHVQPRESLFTLYKRKLIRREKMNGFYIYFSNDACTYQRQTLLRKDYSEKKNKSNMDFRSEILAHELKAAVILFYSTLNEQQRRLYTGLESLKLGYGGDSYIAQLLHVDPHTVAKGRRELLGEDVDFDHIRKKGGGRINVEKKRRKL